MRFVLLLLINFVVAVANPDNTNFVAGFMLGAATVYLLAKEF